MKRYTIQLNETGGGFPRGKLITASGGVCFVAANGGATKVSLQDKDGATLANPVSLTQGGCEFHTANSVASVDLYIMTPGGQFVVKTGVQPGHEDVEVDVTVRNQVALIPFSATDQTGDATETDSGFDEPANAMFTGIGTGIRVITVDATETVDAGTDSTDSGDADGFVTAASVATAGVVADNGALVISTADYIPHVSGGKSITYTLSAGADTAEGLILLPYYLAG